MTVRAAWLLPQGQTREDTRVTPVGTMAPESELTTRGGVVPGGNPFAATPAGAMSVQIGVGRAHVQGTTAQGPYPAAVTAPELLTFTDGDALDRIDTVILRVYDGMYDVEGQALATVEIVQGIAAGAPTPPQLPPASLPLWDVRVRAGASASVGGLDWASALTDRRRYTVAVGGIMPAGGPSSWPGAYDGQYRDLNGVLERWRADTGAWSTYRPPAEAPQATTTGFAPAAGWALNDFNARRRGGTVTFSVYLRRSGGALSDAANLPDTFVGTLPGGWRPLFPFEAIGTDGYGHGAVRIETDGQLYLRTWSPGIVLNTDNNLRVSATYVQ